jgi:hypothetical protein
MREPQSVQNAPNVVGRFYMIGAVFPLSRRLVRDNDIGPVLADSFFLSLPLLHNIHRGTRGLNRELEGT